MNVTHFQVFNKDKPFPYVVAKCWILLYESGILHSFDYGVIYDNIFDFLENGVMHHLTAIDVVCTEIYFPDVFSSCINQKCKQKYTFTKQ